jgi:hypothetical protein
MSSRSRIIIIAAVLISSFILVGCSSDSNPVSSQGSSGAKPITIDQPYPNPFQADKFIEYTVQYSAHVLIQIFDVNGKMRVTLVNEYQHRGTYRVLVNNLGLESGIYFAKITIGEQISTKRLTIIQDSWK